MFKRKIAFLIVLVTLSLGVMTTPAAASDSYPDVRVAGSVGYVDDSPHPYNNYNASVTVDLSMNPTLTASNVTIENETGGTIPVGFPGSQFVSVDVSPPPSGAEYTVLIDGSVYKTVTTRSGVEPAVTETSPINHSKIETADSINMTVDTDVVTDELNKSTQVFYKTQNKSKVEVGVIRVYNSSPQFTDDVMKTSVNAGSVYDVGSGDVTKDITDYEGQYRSIQNTTSDPVGNTSTLTIPNAVEKVEIDGDVVYREETTTPGGGGVGGSSGLDNTTVIGGLIAFLFFTLFVRSGSDL